MKCLSCGFELDADSIFCSKCGKKVELPVKEFVEEVTDDIEDIKSEVENNASDSLIKSEESIEKIVENSEEKIETTIENVKNNIFDKSDSETVFADSDDTVAAIDEALEALNSNSETAEDTLGNVVDEITDKVDLVTEEVTDKVDEVKNENASESAKEIKPLKKIEKVQNEIKEEMAASNAAPLYTQNEINSSVPQQGGAPQFEQQQYTPYNEQYSAPQYTAEVNEPEAPKKVSALRISFAGFIAIITIVFLTLVSLMFCLRIGASGKILKNRTEHMNINTVLDADLGKRSLSDTIYNEAGFWNASQGQVGKAEFRSYLSKSNLLEYTGNYIKDYADYLIDGDIGDPSIDANDMADFFVENSDIADENFSYQLQTSDYNKIRTTLELKDTADNFSIEKWSKYAHFDLGNTSFIFSYVTLGIILGLVIVLLVWIAVIVDGRGKHIVGMYGSVFSCSGGIVFIVGLLAVAGTAIAHIITGWFIFYLLASLLLPFGVLTLCTGAVEFVIGFIFKRIRRGIKNSDKRNKAIEKALMGTAV